MNRRGFLRGILAGAALATGLARTKLELVDDERLTYKGVPVWFDEALESDLDRAWRLCCKPSTPPVMFLTADGAYEFDGHTCRKLSEGPA